MQQYQLRVIRNYVGGAWVDPSHEPSFLVVNPATGEATAAVVDTPVAEVDAAVEAARAALPGWSATPPLERARYLHRLGVLMLEAREELALAITNDEGKTIEDARAEVMRAIENVETAAGVPSLLTGENLANVGRGVDGHVLRVPVGVGACISPFNFPLMIPCWFFPYAIACGNTYIVKPSEVVPSAMNILFRLIDSLELPPGVLNLVNGGRSVADRLVSHPGVAAISFVGSTPVARSVYAAAAAQGKRVQCQGGAKDYLVVMPDAPVQDSIDAIMSSAFGAAGERCLAGSVLVVVGSGPAGFEQRLFESVNALVVGSPTQPGVDMGPLISTSHRERVAGYVDAAAANGQRLLVDGRGCGATGPAYLGPTIVDQVTPDSPLAREEIFGPVLSVIRVDDFDGAVDLVNSSPYGNAAALFTGSGYHAREFRTRVDCGNIGINAGVPAAIAVFPFAGMKDSFFGDLHGQGKDAVEFFTQKKMVVERWRPA